MTRRSLAGTLGVLLVFAAVALLVAAFAGSVALPASAVLDALRGQGDGLANTLVMELRLPRALTAFATGGLLAIAGVFMQVLLRNPLADPYILGVSQGAAVAALGAILLGLSGFWIDLGAFAGALAVIGIVYGVSRGGGAWTPTRLLLTGVVVAAGLNAVISLLLSLGSDSSLRSMLFWMMGDLSNAAEPGAVLAVLAATTAAGVVLARPLNVLAQGDDQALLLGVPVGPLRILVYMLASLMTAIAVTTAGSVGFIGLMVPHVIRLTCGADHRLLVPASALLGGSMLVLADTAARTVLAPRQLPVGALTALLGVPLFLFLLRRGRLYR